MTPAHALGNLLLASALEDGGLETAAAEIGISRTALSDIISGGGMTVATFARVARYLGRSLDETHALAGQPVPAEPHEPRRDTGGRARMDELCSECQARLSRRAAFARWSMTDERQMEIREVTA